MGAFEECSQWRAALSFLRDMCCERLGADAVSFAAVASACAAAGRVEETYGLLLRMSSESLQPSAVVATSAIAVSARALQWRRACSTLLFLHMKGVEVDLPTLGSAMLAYERASQWKGSLKLFKEMSLRALEPDVVACNSAIAAQARGKRWKQAMRLMSSLQAHGFQLDHVSLNSAIGAAAATESWVGDRWAWSLQVLWKAVLHKLQPDVVAFNSAMSSCSKGHQWRLSLALKERLTSYGLLPDGVTHNVMLGAFERSSKWASSLAVLRRMRTARVSDVISFGVAASSCRKRSLWELAHGLVLEAPSSGVKPNLQMLIHASRWRKALKCQVGNARANRAWGDEPHSSGRYNLAFNAQAAALWAKESLTELQKDLGAAAAATATGVWNMDHARTVPTPEATGSCRRWLLPLDLLDSQQVPKSGLRAASGGSGTPAAKAKTLEPDPPAGDPLAPVLQRSEKPSRRSDRSAFRQILCPRPD